MSSIKLELKLKTEVDLTKDQLLELLKEAESIYSYAPTEYKLFYRKCIEDDGLSHDKCVKIALSNLWNYIYDNMSFAALAICNDADVGVKVDLDNNKLYITTVMCRARVKVSGTVPLS